ncbi:patatin-like phospholipase family protein [Paenibacillus monticola]|uniref:PNPLA domain-containing protein n=1 Tax=Paenibacillus monticola TaxID=2666075 RepID=A0A7X2HA78_9BACL|nr:patatin-like phospholipase family protein [Paenibacillus monticola]MRN56384.1 hypothetical protein [Paenibacillus monticola]
MQMKLDKSEKIDSENKKVGLALSGGGYRASFFHLGVLANLAEKDLLRNISVISTVSGGSIVGALYFLKLREKVIENGQLRHLDYIQIVQAVEEDLAAGVSKNIRSKVFLHPLNELRAVFQSREKILAQLYQKYFYKSDLMMHELKVSGLPKLIINATFLRNGGHWYFSQDDMGQYMDNKIVNSKGSISYLKNPVYLKDAIAASSAVPGLFNYVRVNIDSVSHKLVDGGAFDNLGLFSLQNESCDFFILSDGSRQLTEEEFIPRKRLSVLKRSYDASLELNKKMMLESCSDYIHIHLKESHANVDLHVSEALSKLRTDLNNFLPQERNSLSFFAYLLTDDVSCHIIVNTELKGDFTFKESGNVSLMQTPTDKFRRGLRSGRKLNHVSGKGFIQALSEAKYFIVTFLLIFLASFWYALLATSGIIPDNDPVINSYFQALLIIISVVSVYLMFLTSMDDYIHHVDMVIAKLIHLILSLFYLLAIGTAAAIVIGLVIILLTGRFT